MLFMNNLSQQFQKMKQLTKEDNVNWINHKQTTNWWNSLTKQDKGICAWQANGSYHVRNLTDEEITWIWANRYTLEAISFNW